MNGSNSSTARTAPTTRQAGSSSAFRHAHYLAFVAELGCATVKQLQHRFPEVPQRTLYDHVDKLLHRRQLTEIPVRDAKPSHPRILTTTGAAHRLVGDALTAAGHTWEPRALTQRRPTRGYGLWHIEHEVDANWITIGMNALAASREDITVRRVEDNYRSVEPREQLPAAVVPDRGYYTTWRRPAHSFFVWDLLEFDRGTITKADRLPTKLNAYDDWANSDFAAAYLKRLFTRYGDTTSAPYFRLLIVAKGREGEGSDLDRLAKIARMVIPLSRLMQRRIWLTTRSQLIACDFQLDEHIWLRADHAYRWARHHPRHTLTARHLAALPHFTPYPLPRTQTAQDDSG